MSNCDQLNTHTYDGRVYIDEDVKKLILETNKLVQEEKKKLVNFFVNSVSSVNVPEKDTFSIFFLNVIVTDWGQNSNFDVTNNLRAEEVLYICALEWNNIQKSQDIEKEKILKDFSSSFFTQLSDIQFGPCPQGRVTRLWQIAKSFLEFI